MENKFVQIKNKVVTDNFLSDSAFRLYAYLKTHQLDLYSPNYKKICEDMDRSRMSVYRALKELSEHNLIQVLKTQDGYLKIKVIN